MLRHSDIYMNYSNAAAPPTTTAPSAAHERRGLDAAPVCKLAPRGPVPLGAAVELELAPALIVAGPRWYVWWWKVKTDCSAPEEEEGVPVM